MGALDQIEEAVHLLREAGWSALLLHWVGSVPLAFGVLWFTRWMARPGATEAGCAAASVGLVLLLLWMNAWRAVFAMRLRHRLGELPEGRWRAGRVWRLVANQAAFGGAKTLALPLAGSAILPLAWATAFFRNTAVLGDLELREAARRSARLAGFETERNWAGLSILALLAAAVLVNVGLTLFMAPHAVKMLTGYESSFTRAGLYLVTNLTFVSTAVAFTWLAMDPLVQAFYVVRCFRGESVRTGEDVRAGLRRLRAGLPVLLLAVCCWPVRAQVTAPELEASIRKTLAEGEYRRRPPAKESWLAAQTRAAVELVEQWVERVVRWLLDRAPRNRSPRPHPVGMSRWLIALMALLAAVILVLLWRIRRRRAPSPAAPPAVVDLAAEDLLPDRLPEDQWYLMAEERARAGDFRAALRAAYLGSLAWLNGRALISIHAGKTNREYARELRRRGRAVPEAADLFTKNMEAFERCWYGRHAAGPEDVERFRQGLERMKVAVGA